MQIIISLQNIENNRLKKSIIKLNRIFIIIKPHFKKENLKNSKII